MAQPLSTTAIETHLSRLYFSPDRVYKQLKPVTLPFVDFSDTAARCAAATHEFERNQGISPDVYLGLADVYEDGEMVDRMIVMRRLRAEHVLTNLLGKGNDKEFVCASARLVASMHAGLLPLKGAQAEPASQQAIATNWHDNFETIRPHLGSVIDPEQFEAAQRLADNYLTGRAHLFETRIEAGWVRDGHGDLRAEHIYITPDGPRMIDCVAFDDRLRISDALADVAFLAMDLERLLGPDGSIELMRAWNEFTSESHPSSLAHFYVAYRAHIRCKIECLRHAQGQQGADRAAQDYHAQALRHLRLAQIRLVLVGGGPGTGKSTIAEAVAERTGGVWLRTDEIRKDLARMSHDEHAFADPGEGIYTDAMSAKVHGEVMRQTRVLLEAGVSVVVDATWRSDDERKDLRRIAAETVATTTELQCVLAAPLAKERIARRMASLYNPSDASPELVEFIAAHFDAWPESTEIDTAGTVAAGIATACGAIDPAAMNALDTATPIDGGEQTPHRFMLDLSVLRDLVLIDRGIERS